MILKAQSGFFTVETGAGLFVCQLRGKLKQGRDTGDIAAMGDWVEITILPDGSGVIESIQPRRRALVRLDPRPQGEYQQVLLANADQVVFVFSCAHPNPKLRMLDRFLVIAEKQKIPPLIVANKIDLVKDGAVIFGLYEDIGYRVIYTSVTLEKGLEELSAALAGRISALVGPSGVGKSSLLNSIQPGLGLAVNEVSTAVNKGKHTTVTREMFKGYRRLRCRHAPHLRERMMNLPKDLMTFNLRTEAWTAGLAAFQERPVLGWGYGDGIFHRDEPYAQTIYKKAPSIGPHSTFLRVLFHQGLMGIISYVTLIAVAIYVLYRTLPKASGVREKILVASLSVLVGNYVLHSLFESIPLSHLAIVLGLSNAARMSHEDNHTEDASGSSPQQAAG